MKLIEANQAKEFASTFLADKILQAAVNAVVDNCPGTEIVRCKDCKHYRLRNQSTQWAPTKLCCMRSASLNFPEDDFCSYGERRSDDN